jgi:3,4-dihydroxy 2-butanone 4-phosphate synthase / GTP cyclohydrolase II
LHRPLMLSAEDAANRIRRGEAVVLVNSESPETEGALVLAAEFATADKVVFMVTEARGILCLCLTAKRCEELGLEEMSRSIGGGSTPAFTHTIEAAQGVTTGISAHDRARTIEVAVSPESKPDDLVSPGHISPIRVADGGVLGRSAKSEAAVDLTRLAGVAPAAVLCGIVGDDGDMARLAELEEMCELLDLGMVTVDEMILHRRCTEEVVREVKRSRVDTRFGNFERIEYREIEDGREYDLLLRGDLRDESRTPLVHLHRLDARSDLIDAFLGSTPGSLEVAFRTIEREDFGAVLLVGPDGEGREAADGAEMAVAYRVVAACRGGAGTVRLLDGAPADDQIMRRLGLRSQVERELGAAC